jgi:hypothetical protein
MNGTAPIPASSGQTNHHRLNTGGNRRLNHAIHMMALTQARMDPRARAYIERRRGEGRTQRDAVRALKRHLSDVVYQQLRRDAALDAAAATDRQVGPTAPRPAERLSARRFRPRRTEQGPRAPLKPSEAAPRPLDAAGRTALNGSHDNQTDAEVRPARQRD